MVGIKFENTCVPFPTGNGHWLRLVFAENNIVQGHVMLFDGDSVILLDSGGVTTVDVLQQGDSNNQKEGRLCTYTKIVGINFGKREAKPKIQVPS